MKGAGGFSTSCGLIHLGTGPEKVFGNGRQNGRSLCEPSVWGIPADQSDAFKPDVRHARPWQVATHCDWQVGEKSRFSVPLMWKRHPLFIKLSAAQHPRQPLWQQLLFTACSSCFPDVFPRSFSEQPGQSLHALAPLASLSRSKSSWLLFESYWMFKADCLLKAGKTHVNIFKK